MSAIKEVYHNTIFFQHKIEEFQEQIEGGEEIGVSEMMDILLEMAEIMADLELRIALQKVEIRDIKSGRYR